MNTSKRLHTIHMHIHLPPIWNSTTLKGKKRYITFLIIKSSPCCLANTKLPNMKHMAKKKTALSLKRCCCHSFPVSPSLLAGFPAFFGALLKKPRARPVSFTLGRGAAATADTGAGVGTGAAGGTGATGATGAGMAGAAGAGTDSGLSLTDWFWMIWPKYNISPT